MVADDIVRRHSFSPFKNKFKGELAEGKVLGERTLVLKPQTYMNLSGDSVLPAMTFYKIPPENVIVFHDDIDLKIGQIRIKKGGSSGGHNGLKSIDGAIGPDYWRVRIGVGKPLGQMDTASHVLSKFSGDDMKILSVVIESLVAELPLLADKKMESYINKIVLSVKGK
jgi:PTH1 family peptidyl-tRNA hydrolase